MRNIIVAALILAASGCAEWSVYPNAGTAVMVDMNSPSTACTPTLYRGEINPLSRWSCGDGTGNGN